MHSNGRIYIDPNTTGVEVADVQQVLGRGVGDLGLLCSDQEWYLDHIDPITNEPVYALRPVNKINPLAKYKPVQHQKVGLLSLAERASTRFGFGAGLPPYLELTQVSPQNDWVYHRPRGLAHSEWFRLRDFEGYSHGACHPLALKVGRLVNDGESQILLFGDGMSNAARADGLTWTGDQSLSLSELLASGNQSIYNYYIAFLLVDKTAQDNAKALIVTNKTMAAFVGSEHSYYEFKLYAQGAEGYPAIDLLQSTSRQGNTFEVIACLMAGNNPQTGNYAVYDSNTQGFLGFQPYSLGFVSGCDRTEARLESSAFKLDGLQITGVTVTAADTTIQETFNGSTYRAFSIEVGAEFDTSSPQMPNWGDVEAAASGVLTLGDSMSFPFGPSPDGGTSPANVHIAVSLATKRAHQNKRIYATGSDMYLWVMINNGQLIPNTVTATVEIDTPMETPVSNQGTVTIS